MRKNRRLSNSFVRRRSSARQKRRFSRRPWWMGRSFGPRRSRPRTCRPKSVAGKPWCSGKRRSPFTDNSTTRQPAPALVRLPKHSMVTAPRRSSQRTSSFRAACNTPPAPPRRTPSTFRVCAPNARRRQWSPTACSIPDQRSVVATAKVESRVFQPSAPPVAETERIDGVLLTSEELAVVGSSAVNGPTPKGFLRTYSRIDGKPLQELELPGLPVFQSLSASAGRIFVTTQAGQVVCLSD